MEHLFKSWQLFSSDIKAAAYVLLLSDYDGTLTPIVGRPDEAFLSAETRDKLRALAKKPAFKVGIISGRPLGEVKAMVGVEGIYYAGNHGLELEGPGLKFINPAAKAAQVEIASLARQFSAKLGSIEGVIVEDKGLSLSVHYRLVKRDEVDLVAEIFHRIASPPLQEGKIRVTSGKKVWEVRPPIDWHKGKAVEKISKEIKAILKCEQLPVIYLGDDTTDEDAFKILHRPQGWSIFVGQDNPSSNADYFLSSTSEVMDFLSRLLELK
ncbi:MAG: trehalose-phosphatase [Dehalococcoidia bacterium]|nr:MAG: trehalose-phosphatase [Dehalococcoidia bacterium]